jgi:hypothetical protein
MSYTVYLIWQERAAIEIKVEIKFAFSCINVTAVRLNLGNHRKLGC